MAVGNTFGATALSSYGGFWLSFAIILTPGGFNIIASYKSGFDDAFGFFLFVRSTYDLYYLYTDANYSSRAGSYSQLSCTFAPNPVVSIEFTATDKFL